MLCLTDHLWHDPDHHDHPYVHVPFYDANNTCCDGLGVVYKCRFTGITLDLLVLLLQNCVGTIPNLNLPDMYTASPERGEAFCKEHCHLLQEKAPDVPLGLKQFLKYCGSPGGSMHM